MSNYSRNNYDNDEYRQRVKRRSGVYVSPEFEQMMSSNSPYPGRSTRGDPSRVSRVIDENSNGVRRPQMGSPQPQHAEMRGTPTRRPNRAQEKRMQDSNRLGLAVGIVLTVVGFQYFVFLRTPSSVRQIHGYNKNLHAGSSVGGTVNVVETPKQLETRELIKEISHHYDMRLEDKPQSWFFGKNEKQIEVRNAALFHSIAFQQACPVKNLPEPESLIYKSLLKYGVSSYAFDCFQPQGNDTQSDAFQRHARDVYDAKSMGNIETVPDVDVEADKGLISDAHVQHAVTVLSNGGADLSNQWADLDVLWSFLGNELNRNKELQLEKQQLEQSLVLLAQQVIVEKDAKESVVVNANSALRVLDNSVHALSVSVQNKKNWESTVKSGQQDEEKRRAQVEDLNQVIAKESNDVTQRQTVLNEKQDIVNTAERAVAACGGDKAILLRSKVGEIEAEMVRLGEMQEKSHEAEQNAGSVLDQAKSASVGVKREAAKLRSRLRRLHGVDSVTSMGDDELYLTLSSQRDRIRYKLAHLDDSTEDQDDLADLQDEEEEDVRCEAGDERAECSLAHKVEALKEKKKVMLQKRFEQVEKQLRELEGESHEESMAEEVRTELQMLRAELQTAIARWDASRKVVEARKSELDTAKATASRIKQDVLKLRAGLISVLHKIAEQEREAEVCLQKTRKQLQDAEQSVQTAQQALNAAIESLQQHSYVKKSLEGSHLDAENEKNLKLAQFEQAIAAQYMEICQATGLFLTSVSTCDLEMQKTKLRRNEWEALHTKVENAREKHAIAGKAVSTVKHVLVRALK